MRRFVLIIALCSTLPVTAQVQRDSVQVSADDGFLLDAVIEYPAPLTVAEVARVLVLIHGSGPQSMDADLSPVTRDQQENYFFRDVSEALVARNFGVLRYNKRSYQARFAIQDDPSYVTSEAYRAFADRPLEWFVRDAQAAARAAREHFPGAEVYLLGHSQGAYIALQVSTRDADIAGLGLIAFPATTTDVAIFEQTVYRPMPPYKELDANGDGQIDPMELSAEEPTAISLRRQMMVLDLDGDMMLSFDEIMAGNFSNLLVHDLARALRRDELELPRATDILRDIAVPVVFFQGEWDNQTPAYQTKAVQLTARVVWQKAFVFRYFPGLGHALDPRDSYEDLEYGTIDPEARDLVAQELDYWFQ